MAISQMTGVIQHLRSVLRAGAGRTDGQLLEDYISRRDEAAIAALVRRHGPMVWGVCRRVLRNHHDAEDAFQATFLVLIRKAASITSRDLLANWLYGVAHQTALKARATAAKRKGRERQVTDMPEPAVTHQGQWRDLQSLLDEELSRMPDHYRGVIVLCDLEGKTRKEAAGQLRCVEGTVASRLVRARALLAKRLTKRGFTLSGGALGALLAQQAASAAVPNSAVASTIKAAGLWAAGTGAISAKVVALTEGVLTTMLITQLKAVVAVLLILGFLATGATILTCRSAAGQDDKKPAAQKPVEPAAKQEKDHEAFTAWGKEIGGVQAGLGFRPGQRRAYKTGESVRLVVRVRNVGQKAVTFSYFNEFFYENPPSTTDGEGTPVYLEGFGFTGEPKLMERNLAPGTEVELCEMSLRLPPAGDKGKARPVWTLFGTGKFRLQYENVGGGNVGTGEIKFDPVLGKLPTGKLELEVTDAEKLPAKPAKKDAFTAWGKEVGGLQAGLAISNRNNIEIGGNATAVVKLRNLSNKSLTASAWPLWLTGPRVVDTEGRQVRATRAPVPVFDIIPAKITLQPGQTIEAANPTLFVVGAGDPDQPVPEGVMDRFTIYVRPGTYQAGFAGFLQGHPSLATGTVEFKVKEPDKKEEEKPFVAWGKEVGGFQAGLGFRPGEKRAYAHGEKVTLVVHVRNVGKEEVKFKYLRQFFIENPPTVTAGQGKRVPLTRVTALGLHVPQEVNLAPGKEIELYELKLGFMPPNDPGHNWSETVYATGKLRIQYERVLGNSSSGKIDLDPALAKLATGKLELEVKPAEQLPDKKMDKDDITAWGKEVGGLQAGLGFPPRREAGLQARRDGHPGILGAQPRQDGCEVRVRQGGVRG
jgi:RNA polymerase sigma factor (sigma-70 family)